MPNEEAVQRVFEAGWESGGFRFIFETFTDMLTSQQANDTGSEFVRNKIRSIVKDEETAELLCPDHPIMAKRPPLGHHYFETFNKPNVTLVDIKKNPVKEITESGVALSTKDPRTGKDAFDFDIIIYAVGFDASTGPLTRLEVRGKEDQTLGDHWSKSVDTYLGICVEHYPNMFMLSAPQSPFANLPIVLDNSADWIGKCIAYIQKNGYKQMEPKPAAQEKWRKELYDVFDATVSSDAIPSEQLLMSDLRFCPKLRRRQARGTWERIYLANT